MTTTDQQPTATPETSLWVDLNYIEDLEARLATLVARAEKIGVEAPKVEYGPLAVTTKIRKVVDTGHEYKTIIVDAWIEEQLVTVTAPDVKLSGWSLAAVLEWLPGADLPLVNAHPDHEGDLPEVYRTWTTSSCEHCETRRNRREIVVVRHEETGEYKAVGKSCLRDFLGHASAEQILRYWAEWVNFIGSASERDEYDPDRISSGPWTTTVGYYLPWVLSVVAENGWLSRSKARDQGRDATADVALEAAFAELYGKTKKDAARAEAYRPDENAKLAAAAVLAWYDSAEGQEELGNSDYAHNLRVAVDSNYVAWKTAGIIGSIFAAYQNANNRRAERKAAEETKALSDWVGEIKERIVIEIEVVFRTVFEGAYGSTTILKMKDAAGNVYTWFASNYPDLEVGDETTIKGTVKKHDEYRGERQTILTRCKVLETNRPVVEETRNGDPIFEAASADDNERSLVQTA